MAQQNKNPGCGFISALYKTAAGSALPCAFDKNTHQIVELLLEQELKKQPDHPHLLRLKGYILFDEKNYLKSLEYLQRSASKIKPTIDHHYYLGVCLYKVGRFADALPHLLKVSAKHSDADIAFMAGYSLYKSGNAAHARKYIERSLPELETEDLSGFRSEITELALKGLTVSAPGQKRKHEPK